MRSRKGEAEVQVIVENCGITMILRCSASVPSGVARIASNLVGNVRCGFASEISAKLQIDPLNFGAEELRRERNFRVYYLH